MAIYNKEHIDKLIGSVERFAAPLDKGLTDEQVKSLCDLYDNQIAKLRKSNEIRNKEKIV